MQLKPSRLTVNLPAPLVPLVQKRIEEEEYHSLSEYLVALVVYDLLLRKPHKVTSALMRKPRDFREKIFEEIAANFESGDTRPGSWLEHRVEELVRERLGDR